MAAPQSEAGSILCLGLTGCAANGTRAFRRVQKGCHGEAGRKVWRKHFPRRDAGAPGPGSRDGLPAGKNNPGITRLTVLLLLGLPLPDVFNHQFHGGLHGFRKFFNCFRQGGCLQARLKGNHALG